MGGDDSQKLRPWRGMHSSPGRNKLRARWRNQHFSSKPSAPSHDDRRGILMCVSGRPHRRRVSLFRSALEATGQLVGRAYALVFGWWLDNLLARHADKRLAQDIRKHLVLLFNDHAAQIFPNDQGEYRDRRTFDYAVATIVTEDIHLRFFRVRGEFSADISSPCLPHKWESLDSTLTWLEMQQGVKLTQDLPNWTYGFDWSSLDWRAIDQFLAAHWEHLKAATSSRGILEKPRTF